MPNCHSKDNLFFILLSFLWYPPWIGNQILFIISLHWKLSYKVGIKKAIFPKVFIKASFTKEEHLPFSIKLLGPCYFVMKLKHTDTNYKSQNKNRKLLSWNNHLFSKWFLSKTNGHSIPNVNLAKIGIHICV